MSKELEQVTPEFEKQEEAQDTTVEKTDVGVRDAIVKEDYPDDADQVEEVLTTIEKEEKSGAVDEDAAEQGAVRLCLTRWVNARLPG